MRKYQFLVVCFSVFFSGLIIAEEQIVLQNDGTYSGCSDTYIDSKQISANFNDLAGVMVEGPTCGACPDQRTLIKFTIPDNLRIVNVKKAVLSFYCAVDQRPSNVAFGELHYLREEWTSSESTWYAAKSGTNWSNPGGFYSIVAVASVDFGSSPRGKWFDFDVTATINEFLAGTRENNGFLLKAKPGNVDILGFSSSESGTVEERPKLILTTESTGIENSYTRSNLHSSISIMKQGASLVITMPSDGHKTIELLGLNGRIMMRSSSSDKSAALDISDVPSGMYLLNVFADGANAHQEKVFIGR